MRTAFQILKNTAAALIRFGIAYAVFFYVAHFSEVQSVVLAAVAFCAIEGYRLVLKIAEKRRPPFEPFWVSIRPNWHSICHDYGLAAGEKWKELQERCEAAPAEYSILHNGFNFTVLSPTLFYSNDRHTFFGDLDFHIPVNELKPDPDRAFAPQFYVKRSVDGAQKASVIELGLVTQDPLVKVFHPTDKADMPFAQLPEIIFYGYFRPDDYDFDRMKKIDERTKALLVECGWTQKERDPEDSWLHWPFEISHKYFDVTYRGLS